MKIFYTSFILCLSVCSKAQIPKIDTDRPDQTESVNTVPKRWLQFEAGFNYQKNTSDQNEYLTPTLLSKYGLSNRIELRLITTVATYSSLVIPFGTVTETVFEVPELGAKIALFDEKGILPKTSWIFHVGIPGLASYELDKLLFNTRLTMQHTLSKNISLGYNVGVEFDGYSDDPVFIYTFAPGINIGEKWYAYIEAFGSLSEHPEHNIDGGVAYFINDNLKLDLSGGFGISPDAPKYYLSVGISTRFTTKKNNR